MPGIRKKHSSVLHYHSPDPDAIVIDALSFGRDWGEEEFAALRSAGYSGIVESLPRDHLKSAIDALMAWRKRAAKHSDELLIALSASDFERARQTGRTAVLMTGGETTIEHYADHIEHAVSIAGHEHVALSTDFSPQGIEPWATRESWYEPRLKVFKPSYDVRWPPWIPALDSTDRFPNVIRVLSRRGWRARELERLLGHNWLRLFRDTIG